MYRFLWWGCANHVSVVKNANVGDAKKVTAVVHKHFGAFTFGGVYGVFVAGIRSNGHLFVPYLSGRYWQGFLIGRQLKTTSLGLVATRLIRHWVTRLMAVLQTAGRTAKPQLNLETLRLKQCLR